jgi:exopolyphosphatase/guanosine-5'-triphosphate,3'-diphosphate pyrophosphatase
MRLAAIDIGTNTILLLVAEVAADGFVRPVLELQEIPRLGAGVDRNRRLSEPSMQRALRILEQYAQTARQAGAQRILACGTSALRDASNGQDFLRLAQERTGIAIKVLSGREEAERTFVGAVSDLLPEDSTTPCAVIDIGGGSTEVVFGTGRRLLSACSVDVGAVRLTERYFHPLPPSPEALRDAGRAVHSSLSAIAPGLPVGPVIGVAGTPVTLASMVLNLPAFDPIATHGKKLHVQAIHQMRDRLASMSSSQVAQLPQVQPGREDVLLAGTMILAEVLQQLHAEEMWVSSRGLRYGIAMVDGMQ